MPEPWFDELAELIAIPSVSADPEHAGDVRRAAEWVRDMVVSAGGEGAARRDVSPAARDRRGSRLVRRRPGADRPLLLPLRRPAPAPLDLWESDPFTLVERDGWLYARGVTDDKGQLYMVLSAVRGLAADGRLPVNVRIAFDGEEEVGGTSISEWVGQDDGPADACLILDGGMTERDKPEFTIATRGLIAFDLRVRTGSSDCHSGMFGNAGLNAIHALIQCLQAILPRDGRLPEPLRAGILEPSAEEIADWGQLKPGAELLAEAGIAPYDERAAEEFYLRTGAEPSAEINGIHAGSRSSTRRSSRRRTRTSRCGSRRPGSARDRRGRAAVDRGGGARRGRGRARARAGRATRRRRHRLPAIQLGLDAFERALGVRPLLTRVGGTMPVLATLLDRGVPTMLTGFGLLESNVHAPNERLPAESVPQGIAAVQELFVALGELR